MHYSSFRGLFIALTNCFIKENLHESKWDNTMRYAFGHWIVNPVSIKTKKYLNLYNLTIKTNYGHKFLCFFKVRNNNL